MTQETEVTKDSTKVILGEGNEVIILKKGQVVEISDSLDIEEIDDDFTYLSGLEIGFTGISMTNAVKDQYKWFEINNS